ncbi:MAG: hypothetical protein ABIL25_07810 [candidate division WOR-3 bacterium]
MRFNWVDLLSIALVAGVGGVQFTRGIKDLSRVFYEAVFLIAAVIAASRLFDLTERALSIKPFIAFAGVFVLAAALGIWLANLLNRVLAFDMGGFNYLFALGLGVVCGWVIGHAVLRSLYLALSGNKEQLVTVHRSWMASQLLFFGAFREFLVILRFARYSNVPE